MNFQAYSLSKHSEWTCLQVKSPESESRTPVHLCCVIDTSASMEAENKLEIVKQSLHFLLDFLGPQDKISIITFSESAKQIITQTAVNAVEKDNIRARISIIRIESNTNLSAGIIQARETLFKDTSNVKQGILVLTDGHANLGLTRPQDILELVQNTVRIYTGTTISTIGYGMDHNAELLQNISTDGCGSYYVVNNVENVATVFGDILGALVSCVAQQVRVILPKSTQIKSRYSNNIIENQIEVVIGDMPAGTEAAFLAKIPVGTTINMKGYNLRTHNSFEMNTTVIETTDSSLQVDGEAHYLRFEVLELLDESRALLLSVPTSTEVTELVTKITTCINTITDYRREHEHSLWDTLLDELNTMKTTLEHRDTANIDTPQLMTQHAGYLGRMRGIAATLSLTPSPAEPMAPVPLGRTFSNYAQRQISSALAATVTTPLPRRPGRNHLNPLDSQDPQNPQDPTSVVSQSTSPVLAPGIPLLPIIPPLSSPVRRLNRQDARSITSPVSSRSRE